MTHEAEQIGTATPYLLMRNVLSVEPALAGAKSQVGCKASIPIAWVQLVPREGLLG